MPVVLCLCHNLLGFSFRVRPHDRFTPQIYNKKTNCVNTQCFFCMKNKKKLFFISLFGKIWLFLPRNQ